MQEKLILNERELNQWPEYHTWVISKAATERRPAVIDNSSIENAILAIVSKDLHQDLWLNRWTGRNMYGKEQWSDNLRSFFKGRLEFEYKGIGYCPNVTPVWDAMCAIAEVKGKNPRVEEISHRWDEVDRYPGLHQALNQAPDDYLAYEIVKLLVRGVVVRALHPGAEFPYCPILFSRQGVGKGDFLKALAGGYHAELIMATFNHPNAQQQMMERFRGKSVVEVGEFSAQSGRALDTMKTIIGDSEFAGVRAAYGREAKDWPMTAIMVGTTNKEHILTDDENRRHPVLTIEGRIDLEWIRGNIEQLWAQAHAEFFSMVEMHYQGHATDDDIMIGNSGRPRVQIPSRYWEEMEIRSERHRQPSELEDWLREEFLPIHDGYMLKGQLLMTSCIARFGKVSPQELSHSMRACGWAKTRAKIDNKFVNVWIGPMGGTTISEVVPLLS